MGDKPGTTRKTRPPYSAEPVAVSCDLLPGERRQVERVSLTSIFADKSGPDTSDMNRMGYVWPHDSFVRNVCIFCEACQPVRLCVERFEPGETQRRTIVKNRDMTIGLTARCDMNEHYRLYNAHHVNRFGIDGNYYRSTLQDLIGNKHIPGRVLEFRLDGALAGGMIFNDLDDGAIAQLSYYDTALSKKRGIGTFMIMEMARRVKETGKPYLYLGTWLASGKLAYKRNFQPMEAMNRKNEWMPLP